MTTRVDASKLLAFESAFAVRLRGALASAPHPEQLGAFVVGGKMLRARLGAAATRAVGGSSEIATTVGLALECLHSAALIQDDIIDDASVRRGRPALHVVLGPGVALMLADYLIFEAMSSLLSGTQASPERAVRAARQVADCVKTCCAGQVADVDLGDVHDPAAEERYQSLIARKTGAQFVAAATLGPILAGSDAETLAELAGYGAAVGAAFQLRDDALDLRGDPRTMGKPVGNSVAHRRLLLPLIYAAQAGTTLDDETVWERVAAEERRLLARADAHLARLPDNDGTALLRAVAERAVHRNG